MVSLNILNNIANSIKVGGSSIDLGALGAFLGVLFLIAFVVAVITVIVYWRIFAKAGRPGWAALVPFYQTWVLFDVLGWKPWLSLVYAFSGVLGYVNKWLFMLWALAAVVVSFMIAFRLAKKFGKSGVFAFFGLILFPYIGYPMLAFGKAQYQK